MKEFILPGCPNPINIPHHLQLQLVQFANLHVSRVSKSELIDLLSRAEKEVKLMLSGVFQRFETSTLFKEYLRANTSSKRMSLSLRMGSLSARSTTPLLFCGLSSLFETIVATILKRNGYKITMVQDAAQAIKLLGEHYYEVVLVDDGMPGDDVLKVLQLQSTSTKVGGGKFLCMMGDKSRWNESFIINAGYGGIVRKPFNYQIFERSKAMSIVEREVALSSLHELHAQ